MQNRLSLVLSERGKKISMPSGGILEQTRNARDTKINATIGVAYTNDHEIMELQSITKQVSLDPHDFLSYAPTTGIPELRNAWQKELLQKNPSLKESAISLPIVTQGITHGLWIAGYLFVDIDDTIILPELYWGNYTQIFATHFGAHMKTHELFSKETYGYNCDALTHALTQTNAQKKIILFNFPQNPSGYTPTTDEVKKIIKVLLSEVTNSNTQLVCIIDDAYFGLNYERSNATESLFAQLSNLHEQIFAIKIDGASKEEFAWGMRVGFITFGGKNVTQEDYALLENKTAGIIRSTISSAAHISQRIIYASMQDPQYQKEKQKNFSLLQERYIRVKEVLATHPEFKKYFVPLPYNSGYFMCITLTEPIGFELVSHLITHYATGVIAINNACIRIAFSSVATQDIEQLFLNIFLALQDILPENIDK